MFRLEDCIAYITSRGAKVLAERLEERFEGSGISRVQWIAMYYVNGCPSITQKQLADKMNLKEPTVVRLLDRMEADHMLRRVCSRTDRRVRYLEMTEQGWNFTRGFLGVWSSLRRTPLRGLTRKNWKFSKRYWARCLITRNIS